MNSTPEAHYENGVKLYNDGFYLRSKEDIQSIVNALKSFIKANKLQEEDSMLKPKTLYYIALCNYKMGNIEISYQIAKKAKDLIPNTITNSSILGITPETIGGNSINELIETLEDNFHTRVHFLDVDNMAIDENVLELELVSKYL